jgi:lipoate-protein ligase A
MRLEILPFRRAGAAENMAADFLLLKHAPPALARFRHYGWRAPAFTFGYSQKIADIRSRLPSGESFDLARRATGGGLVDHRDDWTYALVLPRGHPAEEMRATQSYRLVHEALAAALVEQGVPAGLQAAPESPPEGGSPAGVCFGRAETFDVCHRLTGTKLAGAAQKRAKQGLLLQGSIWRPAAGPLDWDRFGARFVAGLAEAFADDATPAPWPDELTDDALEFLTAHYASPEWLEAR